MLHSSNETTRAAISQKLTEAHRQYYISRNQLHNSFKDKGNGVLVVDRTRSSSAQEEQRQAGQLLLLQHLVEYWSTQIEVLEKQMCSEYNSSHRIVGLRATSMATSSSAVSGSTSDTLSALNKSRHATTRSAVRVEETPETAENRSGELLRRHHHPIQYALHFNNMKKEDFASKKKKNVEKKIVEGTGSSKNENRKVGVSPQRRRRSSNLLPDETESPTSDSFQRAESFVAFAEEQEPEERVLIRVNSHDKLLQSSSLPSSSSSRQLWTTTSEAGITSSSPKVEKMVSSSSSSSQPSLSSAIAVNRMKREKRESEREFQRNKRGMTFLTATATTDRNDMKRNKLIAELEKRKKNEEVEAEEEASTNISSRRSSDQSAVETTFSSSSNTNNNKKFRRRASVMTLRTMSRGIQAAIARWAEIGRVRAKERQADRFYQHSILIGRIWKQLFRRGKNCLNSFQFSRVYCLQKHFNAWRGFSCMQYRRQKMGEDMLLGSLTLVTRNRCFFAWRLLSMGSQFLQSKEQLLLWTDSKVGDTERVIEERKNKIEETKNRQHRLKKLEFLLRNYLEALQQNNDVVSQEGIEGEKVVMMIEGTDTANDSKNQDTKPNNKEFVLYHNASTFIRFIVSHRWRMATEELAGSGRDNLGKDLLSENESMSEFIFSCLIPAIRNHSQEKIVAALMKKLMVNKLFHFWKTEVFMAKWTRESNQKADEHFLHQKLRRAYASWKLKLFERTKCEGRAGKFWVSFCFRTWAHYSSEARISHEMGIQNKASFIRKAKKYFFRKWRRRYIGEVRKSVKVRTQQFSAIQKLAPVVRFALSMLMNRPHSTIFIKAWMKLKLYRRYRVALRQYLLTNASQLFPEQEASLLLLSQASASSGVGWGSPESFPSSLMQSPAQPTVPNFDGVAAPSPLVCSVDQVERVVFPQWTIPEPHELKALLCADGERSKRRSERESVGSPTSPSPGSPTSLSGGCHLATVPPQKLTSTQQEDQTQEVLTTPNEKEQSPRVKRVAPPSYDVCFELLTGNKYSVDPVEQVVLEAEACITMYSVVRITPLKIFVTKRKTVRLEGKRLQNRVGSSSIIARRQDQDASSFRGSQRGSLLERSSAASGSGVYSQGGDGSIRTSNSRGTNSQAQSATGSKFWSQFEDSTEATTLQLDEDTEGEVGVLESLEAEMYEQEQNRAERDEKVLQKLNCQLTSINFAESKGFSSTRVGASALEMLGYTDMESMMNQPLFQPKNFKKTKKKKKGGGGRSSLLSSRKASPTSAKKHPKEPEDTQLAERTVMAAVGTTNSTGGGSRVLLEKMTFGAESQVIGQSLSTVLPSAAESLISSKSGAKEPPPSIEANPYVVADLNTPLCQELLQEKKEAQEKEKNKEEEGNSVITENMMLMEKQSQKQEEESVDAQNDNKNDKKEEGEKEPKKEEENSNVEERKDSYAQEEEKEGNRSAIPTAEEEASPEVVEKTEKGGKGEISTVTPSGGWVLEGVEFVQEQSIDIALPADDDGETKKEESEKQIHKEEDEKTKTGAHDGDVSANQKRKKENVMNNHEPAAANPVDGSQIEGGGVSPIHFGRSPEEEEEGKDGSAVQSVVGHAIDEALITVQQHPNNTTPMVFGMDGPKEPSITAAAPPRRITKFERLAMIERLTKEKHRQEDSGGNMMKPTSSSRGGGPVSYMEWKALPMGNSTLSHILEKGKKGGEKQADQQHRFVVCNEEEEGEKVLLSYRHKSPSLSSPKRSMSKSPTRATLDETADLEVLPLHYYSPPCLHVTSSTTMMTMDPAGRILTDGFRSSFPTMSCQNLTSHYSTHVGCVPLQQRPNSASSIRRIQKIAAVPVVEEVEEAPQATKAYINPYRGTNFLNKITIPISKTKTRGVPEEDDDNGEREIRIRRPASAQLYRPSTIVPSDSRVAPVTDANIHRSIGHNNNVSEIIEATSQRYHRQFVKKGPLRRVGLFPSKTQF